MYYLISTSNPTATGWQQLTVSLDLRLLEGMGDFAAGKVFSQVEVVELTPDNFDQFITDAEEKFVALGCDAELGPPGHPDDLAQIQSALFQRVLGWHDGAPLSEVNFYSWAQIVEKGAYDADGNLPLGEDLNGDLLHMDAKENVFLGGESLGQTLGAYLGMFWFDLCKGDLEWADGWVKKG